MATIEPGRDLDIIEWIEAQARKDQEIVPFLVQWSPALDDMPPAHGREFQWRSVRIPRRRTPRPDMAQMIEDIARAR
jgi:hypothetical protein